VQVGDRLRKMTDQELISWGREAERGHQRTQDRFRRFAKLERNGAADILAEFDDCLSPLSWDVGTELQKIYDSEINVHIELSWLWDDGINVRLGDRLTAM
jgi:hypothetical protein